MNLPKKHFRSGTFKTLDFPGSLRTRIFQDKTHKEQMCPSEDPSISSISSIYYEKAILIDILILIHDTAT